MLNNDDSKYLDPSLEKDLKYIVNKVQLFLTEKDSIIVSLLRQKRLPELYENSRN